MPFDRARLVGHRVAIKAGFLQHLPAFFFLPVQVMRRRLGQSDIQVRVCLNRIVNNSSAGIVLWPRPDGKTEWPPVFKTRNASAHAFSGCERCSKPKFAKTRSKSACTNGRSDASPWTNGIPGNISFAMAIIFSEKPIPIGMAPKSFAVADRYQGPQATS